MYKTPENKDFQITDVEIGRLLEIGRLRNSDFFSLAPKRTGDINIETPYYQNRKTHKKCLLKV